MNHEHFKAALGLVGMSQSDAAAYLDIREDTVQKFCSGRQPVGKFAWSALSNLYASQRKAIAARNPELFQHALSKSEAVIRAAIKLEEIEDARNGKL